MPFFLKKVAPWASSAITISWPVLCIMLAISYMLSLGSSIKAGHYLGEKKPLKAREMVSTTLWVSIWVNLILTVLLMVKLKSVILIFGADAKTLPYTYDYLKIMLPGMIFEDLTFIAGMYLRAEGNSWIVVITTILQTISNTVFNYLLITRWHLGAEGAAIASFISFVLQAVILFMWLFSKHSLLKPSFKLIRMNRHYFKTVISVGFSGFATLSLFALSQFLMNREASTLGTAYLTANTVLLFIAGIAFSVTLGITDGAEPLLAYAFGARNRQRLFKVTKYLILITMLTGATMGTSLLAFPDEISSLFTGDQNGIVLAENSVRLTGLSLFFMPLITVLHSLCVSMGKGIMASMMGTFRQVLTSVLIVVLPHLWGGKGLVFAQPVALLAGSLFVIGFIPAVIGLMKNIPKESSDHAECSTAKKSDSFIA